MRAQPAKSHKVIEVYELLLVAATRRQPVAAIYDGLPRLLCLHVLGRKQGQLHALVYQVGGGSHSGLPVTPARAGVWRCLAVEKLSQVELRAGEWNSEPRSSRQTCIDEVDFDVDAQPGAEPQNGQ
jgi:hypothetical protein